MSELQAWWTCPASGNPSAETFEWHMAQVVARYFGSNFHVSLTGGSHDGGVDVWVARRGAAGQAPHAPSQPSSAGAQASPDQATMVYECAVQVKRYQAPLSDASVREFADKFALRAKRGIFIAPGGFGLSAQRFAASKGSWLGEDKVHWLQLWDALALKKLMAQFGDDWCKSVLAARPSSRPWPLPPAPLFNPQVPSSPPGGSSSTARAGAEPAAAPSGLPPGTQGEAGTEGASSLLRVGACAAASGDERSADQARGHVEAGAGAEAEVLGQLLCRIPGCNCARPKGRRAAAVQSVLVPAPAGGSSPLAAAGVGQAGDVSAATSCRTPLKAQPGRLNAGVAQNGVAHCAVLGSEDRSSKRFKFDEDEVCRCVCRGMLQCSTHGIVLASPPALTCRRLVRRSSKFTAFLSARCAALSYPAPSHLPKCSRASSTNSQVPLTSTRMSAPPCTCAQASERSGDWGMVEAVVLRRQPVGAEGKVGEVSAKSRQRLYARGLGPRAGETKAVGAGPPPPRPAHSP